MFQQTAVGVRYDPPGGLDDFTPRQREQWHVAVSGWFDEIIAFHEEHTLRPGDPCQYYNQAETTPPTPGLVQAIPWNALSNTLVRRNGHAKALELAERLYPLTDRIDGAGAYFTGEVWEKTYYRPHDEYCEFRVEHDAQGKIARVVFTSEPPEYWQALHGDTLPGSAPGSAARYDFDPNRDMLLDLYRRHVHPSVRLADLQAAEDLVDESSGEVIVARGAYNPWNRWNTTHGIMHLCQPANTLTAEIVLGADATVPRARGGRPIEHADALLCAAGYGGPMRNSDPTIGGSVNVLARQGFWITLRNPVGLYMNHLDLAGITHRDGRPVTADYFRVERGDARQHLIERAVFEIPPDAQRRTGEPETVGDLLIAGDPIRYGAQLAERITVALFGVANPGEFRTTPLPATHRGCQDRVNGMFLRVVPVTDECPDGTRPAFDYPGSADVAHLRPAPEPHKPHRHRA
ncbi:hypothetical protein GCM10022243_39370 [Saccharothrix violaceirubra]|uniref:Uncharacterized protein n=1 Tax=Saccharothrix violaceirubra TaxID=413306 RepID=A0A7W7WUI2_9PSEU|nr:hypothetical protein [Saccharothrix violaceirubra]MBB4964279.1 hypothetical protein [Saccharothrix violaceirubra]